MSWFNNKGYRLPTEPNKLIEKTLIDKRINNSYIVFNEQEKVLEGKEDPGNWDWYIRKR